ncbi:MAG TPA: 2-succinyl-5-enolpyruvyl-6-hydroxy-3-cyclohexene-1-carboxylic-acid synthase [Melioribacteraceae bacterium]|nr:2-succinyl-5-enolpyruvyl-6-hydroxy-3-cyclohexene-1-carboxylic-acid synthase [Melioribacteraceae bacterium]
MNYNNNFLFASVFVNRLQFLGVKYAVISPGSRNTPLIAALDYNKNITKSVILDERAAGFFALGIAKATDNPVLIVTTSGTAVAELYPSIVEAYQSRIPLIICSADRPQELLNCGENQTINQDNIFANHINGYFYFSNLKYDIDTINYLINSATESYNIAKHINKGPVHINFPFSKPLEPNSFNIFVPNELQQIIKTKICEEDNNFNTNLVTNLHDIKIFISELYKYKKGLFIIGGNNYSNEFYDDLYKTAKKLGFLIYADILSSFRFNHLDTDNILINNLPLILENKDHNALLSTEIIIRLGKTPINKRILDFFANSKAKKILINKFGDLYDPSRSTDKIFNICENTFVNILSEFYAKQQPKDLCIEFNKIIKQNIFIETNKDKILNNYPFNFEGNFLRLVSYLLPKELPLVVSNSMPVRFTEFFAIQTNNKNIIYCNRGASGIDGNTATALGIAFSLNKPSIFITGDLSFLHDIGSLMYLNQLNLPICIIVIDNNGGGIFNMLPIASNKELLNNYFITPQNQNIKAISKAFRINYCFIENRKDFMAKINNFYDNKKPLLVHVKNNLFTNTELFSQFKREILE